MQTFAVDGELARRPWWKVRSLLLTVAPGATSAPDRVLFRTRTYFVLKISALVRAEFSALVKSHTSVEYTSRHAHMIITRHNFTVEMLRKCRV